MGNFFTHAGHYAKDIVINGVYSELYRCGGGGEVEEKSCVINSRHINSATWLMLFWVKGE